MSIKTEYLTPPQAAERAGVTDWTVIAWCRRFPGLGRKIVGRWRVDPAALDRLLCGHQPPAAGGDDRARAS